VNVYREAVSLNIAGLRNVLQLCKQMSKLEVNTIYRLLTYTLTRSIIICTSVTLADNGSSG